MPLYHYQYVDSLGKKRSGAIEAQGDREAKEKLREQGLLITRLQAKSKVSKKQNLKGDALLAFTVQLSQLINAGVPLYESLIAIEEQSRGDPYHRVILVYVSRSAREHLYRRRWGPIQKVLISCIVEWWLRERRWEHWVPFLISFLNF